MDSTRYEYKVAYVVAWEMVSVEGKESRREKGERNSAFGRRVLNEFGADGWELTTVQPTLQNPQAAYYVFKRPLAAGAEPDLSVVKREEQAPEAGTQPQQPQAPAADAGVVTL